MNKKVGNTISSRILSAIGVLFLVFMALFILAYYSEKIILFCILLPFFR